MNNLQEHQIEFQINNDERITITIPIDGTDELFQLTNNDGYTSRYIIEALNSGLISIRDPLEKIYRVEGESRILIYSASAQTNHDIENEVEDYQEDDASASFSEPSMKRCEWSDGETRMLLDYYEQFVSRVGPMKKFKNKRSMWSEIAKILNDHFGIQRTSIQVENRYKTVLKRKKSAIENNRRSGSTRMDVPFETELNKINALDDSREPEVVGTAQGVTVLKPHNEKNMPATSCSATPVRKHITIHDTLREINEKKEEAKERRHKEKLELIRELLGGKNA